MWLLLVNVGIIIVVEYTGLSIIINGHLLRRLVCDLLWNVTLAAYCLFQRFAYCFELEAFLFE